MLLGSVCLLAVTGMGVPEGGPPAIGWEEADRRRIRRHLAAVERRLRERDVSDLAAELRQARQENLDRLRAYWRAGVFPRNDDFPGTRVPYFIDDHGAVCAVGHLVIESGFADVAEEIRQTENNAHLLDMKHAALAGWIAQSGLTAEEHAAIQPAYCGCGHDGWDPVCGTDGVTYANACYATTCAGVEIAYWGHCEGDGTTGWPSAGTSNGDSTGESTGAGEERDADDGSTTIGDAAGDSETAADGSTPAEHDEPPEQEEDDLSRGCGCSGGNPPMGSFLLLVALWPWSRRRP
jgi:uncharacterized protein (TIGR03382 family)